MKDSSIRYLFHGSKCLMECLLSKVGGHLIIQMETERIDFEDRNNGKCYFFYFLMVIFTTFALNNNKVWT